MPTRRRTRKRPHPGAEVAAVDLGSNSFHMLVARDNSGQLQVLDRLREPVRLAAGLDERRRLRPEAQARALSCLERFGQRLRGIPPERVRVVGTNTLRRLQDGASFIAAAERAIGHQLEVISGVEEARLVYHGVTHGLGKARPRRLIVDIGGGSTELIIGRGNEPKLMESVSLGCVVHTQRFFSDGVITASRMREARIAARVELEFLERRYRASGWDVAIGASGTVRGAWRVMMAQEWTDELITRDALEKAINLTVKAGSVANIGFPGLRDDRRPVFAGGIAVLAGVFDSLGLQKMETSEYALREGVIYDLLGRLSDHDVRDESVAALAQRTGADERHAADIEHTVLKLLDEAGRWVPDRPAAIQLLRWAARLHEIGLAISHDGYHRHSEYILRNADLFGFSQTGQKLLAALVRLHRGKFTLSVIEEVPAAWREMILRLAVLMRLAVVLHRSRTPGLRVPFRLRTAGDTVKLGFRPGWLQRHPLTREDLELEVDYLKPAGFRLKFS
jgi:exopolyphosphatase/guanosine-5'-triphosphate,3'-diphosphate pyrophosphatase